MLERSKYLDRMQKALANTGEDFVLTANFLLVERITIPELKTKSGLILAGDDKTQVNSVQANLPVWVRVLAVGAGYYDDTTGEDKPLDTQPGNILIVGQASVKWFGNMGFKDYKAFDIGITEEAQTQMRFKDEAAFNRWVATLDGET